MKKHSTLERLDLGREIRILALGLIGSLIMAINMKSFVHTGGLYPGGFNGVTLLIQTSFQRFLGISLPFSPISLALNAIPAIFSFRAIGKRFTLNTALIIVATSVFTDIVPANADHAGHPADQCVWRSDQRCCDQFVSDRRDFNGRNGFHCCVFSGKEKSGCLEFYPHGECHCFSTGRFAVWMGQGPLLHYFSVHIDTDDRSALSGT